MSFSCSTLAILSSLFLTLGCQEKESSSSASEETKTAAAPSSGETKKPRKERTKKDRGEASMKLGETEWTADAAKVKTRGNTLTIKASNTEMVDGKAKRQELHLQLKDVNGPGDYVTGISGSRFLGVGIDMKKAQEEGKESKAAMDAISGSKHLMLSQAKVHIDSMNDDEVVGTFSWTPPKGHPNAAQAITDGKFRARFRKKK